MGLVVTASAARTALNGGDFRYSAVDCIIAKHFYAAPAIRRATSWTLMTFAADFWSGCSGRRLADIGDRTGRKRASLTITVMGSRVRGA
jgi:hypothetical protein